jgi:hypothetical protein
MDRQTVTWGYVGALSGLLRQALRTYSDFLASTQDLRPFGKPRASSPLRSRIRSGSGRNDI